MQHNYWEWPTVSSLWNSTIKNTLIFLYQPLSAFFLSISTPSAFEVYHKNTLYKFTVIKKWKFHIILEYKRPAEAYLLGDFDFIFRTCRSFNFARLLKFGRIRSSFSELRSLIVIGLRFTEFSMPPSGKTMRQMRTRFRDERMLYGHPLSPCHVWSLWRGSDFARHHESGEKVPCYCNYWQHAQSAYAGI